MGLTRDLPSGRTVPVTTLPFLSSRSIDFHSLPARCHHPSDKVVIMMDTEFLPFLVVELPADSPFGKGFKVSLSWSTGRCAWGRRVRC